MNNNVLLYSNKYEEELKSWFDQWEIPHAILDTLPNTGYIIPNIGVAFIYETNSKVCFIEGFIGNKNIDKDIRNEGLNMILNEIYIVMKDKGYKYISGHSAIKAVRDRAEVHGFTIKHKPYYSFYRSL